MEVNGIRRLGAMTIPNSNVSEELCIMSGTLSYGHPLDRFWQLFQRAQREQFAAIAAADKENCV